MGPYHPARTRLGPLLPDGPGRQAPDQVAGHLGRHLGRPGQDLGRVDRQGQDTPVGQALGLVRVIQDQGHLGLGVPEAGQLPKDRVDLAPAPGPVQVLARQGPGRVGLTLLGLDQVWVYPPPPVGPGRFWWDPHLNQVLVLDPPPGPCP